jgi:hypothetical protein
VEVLRTVLFYLQFCFSSERCKIILLENLSTSKNIYPHILHNEQQKNFLQEFLKKNLQFLGYLSTEIKGFPRILKKIKNGTKFVQTSATIKVQDAQLEIRRKDKRHV